MKFRYSISTLALVLSTAAIAHTHLEGSVPQDKSHVQAPTAIELHFSEAARLTALTLQKGKDAAVPVKPLPTTAMADFSVPVPSLAAGDYVVNWRVASDDGHVMSGKFGFTVDVAAPATAARMPMPMHKAMNMADHNHLDHMQAGDSEPAAAGDEHKH